MKIDGEACAEQTRIAKTQDLERFLDDYNSVVGSDSKQLWTRSISEGFQKHLKKQRSQRTRRKLAASTIHRVFATLRTATKRFSIQRVDYVLKKLAGQACPRRLRNRRHCR